MNRRIKIALLILATVGVSACSRLQPVEVIHQKVPASSQAPLTTSSLRPALIQALLRNRWTIEQDEPNRLLARLDFRGHSASITLDYVADRYDIRYRDSEELGYKNGKIHKRYNALVKKLDRTIQQEVRLAQSLATIPRELPREVPQPIPQ